MTARVDPNHSRHAPRPQPFLHGANHRGQPIEPALPQLPQAPESERCILAGFLLDSPGIEAALDLNAEDFYISQHRAIFGALKGLHRQRQPTNDLALLVEHLRETGKLEEAGGAPIVSALMDAGVPQIQNVAVHIKTLQEKTVQRRAMDLGRRASEPHGAQLLPEIAQLGELARTVSNGNGAAAEPAGWREAFHTFEEFENAPGLSFSIEGFLQNDAATMIGGLSGHGKTLVMLSMVKALLAGKGTRLWDTFAVTKTAVRVLYLIPESAIGPFGHRLKLFGLYDSLRPDDGRLLVRTLSKGPTPCLSDPRILYAAKGAHVFLDTAVRFSPEGDENSASDNQRGLATDIFALLGVGARCVAGAHHAPKPFAKESVMRLENVLRGSGDVGAMLATCWALKQVDREQNIVHVENVKPRDFQPVGPFQIIGRPYIDTEGDFRIHKRPGDCGALQDEQEPERDKGGASAQAREARLANIALLRTWHSERPTATSEEHSKHFHDLGIKVSPSTVRKYKMELEI